jgi:hypothetical protein
MRPSHPATLAIALVVLSLQGAALAGTAEVTPAKADRVSRFRDWLKKGVFWKRSNAADGKIRIDRAQRRFLGDVSYWSDRGDVQMFEHALGEAKKAARDGGVAFTPAQESALRKSALKKGVSATLDMADYFAGTGEPDMVHHQIAEANRHAQELGIELDGAANAKLVEKGLRNGIKAKLGLARDFASYGDPEMVGSVFRDAHGYAEALGTKLDEEELAAIRTKAEANLKKFGAPKRPYAGASSDRSDDLLDPLNRLSPLSPLNPAHTINLINLLNQ